MHFFLREGGITFKHHPCFQVVGVLAQVKSEKELVKILVPSVENADRLSNVTQNMEEVYDLKSKLDAGGQGVRSVDEIQLELNSLQLLREVKNTMRETDKFTLDLNEEECYQEKSWF